MVGRNRKQKARVIEAVIGLNRKPQLQDMSLGADGHLCITQLVGAISDESITARKRKHDEIRSLPLQLIAV
ncbi:hypothetical protein AAFF_G00309690 [Aldrovandia affinis]|uniref:Uncharacterized protein n=1 Tax=Aldrovandia affinis TaxID=143900 RepID=A0AAD7SP23_9TELE|nr:hypothetical protein AAFF_G00309690 [Aldrovandia affinis]